MSDLRFTDEQRIPTLIFLIGPPAVGKMTVGQALARRTGLPLFHLHQVVDIVTEFFVWGTPPYNRLVNGFRSRLFAEASQAGLSLITTGGWDFDAPADAAIFAEYVEPYVARGHRIVFVELLASQATRLARNRTENRRTHKKTDWATDEYLRNLDLEHRLDSGGVLPLDLPLLRIDTEQLTAEETAERIRLQLGLPLAAPSD